MTTPPRPYETVTAPVVLPYRYGLLSAAQVVEAGDGHWQMGVQYVSDTCHEGGGVWEWPPWCGWPPSWTITLTATATARTFTVTVATRGGPVPDITVSIDGAAPEPLGDTLTIPAEAVDPTRLRFTSNDGDVQAELEVNPDAAEGTVYTVTGIADGPSVVKHAKGVETVEAPPFTVWDGVLCQALGLQDAAGIARRRLALTEQMHVEYRVWTRQLAPEADVILPAGQEDPATVKAIPLAQGIGLAELYMAMGVGGIGVLHVPRQVGTIAYSRQLILDAGPQRRTIYDTPVALGAGYDPAVGPEGAPAANVAAGESWIYLSGPVVARRGPVFVPATETSGALDPATNEVQVLAERTYVVTLDCYVGAVLVTTGGNA